MKFLFTYYTMNTGGIETLILRLSDWLIDHGHEVDLLLIKKEGELLDKIHPKVNIFTLKRYAEIHFLKNVFNKTYPNDYDVIYSFSPVTLWMAALLKAKLNQKSVLFNGIYHFQDFKLFGDKFNTKLFLDRLPDECKIFMTPPTRLEHEVFFNRTFNNSYIWPLAINIPKGNFEKRETIKYKIVSIGRLADFKTYNLYMLDVINLFRTENINIEYHIYGTGMLEHQINEKINNLNLQNCVTLHPTIDYSLFSKVISDAYVFIGMGTAAIEAALYGVPSIVAIANSEEAITYGLVNELPDYNCGEPISNFKYKSVYSLLKSLFDLNELEYSELSKNSRTAMIKQYDIDILMKSLFDYIGQIKEKSIFINEEKWPILYVLNKTTNRIREDLKARIKSLLIR